MHHRTAMIKVCLSMTRHRRGTKKARIRLASWPPHLQQLAAVTLETTEIAAKRGNGRMRNGQEMQGFPAYFAFMGFSRSCIPCCSTKSFLIQILRVGAPDTSSDVPRSFWATSRRPILFAAGAIARLTLSQACSIQISVLNVQYSVLFHRRDPAGAAGDATARTARDPVGAAGSGLRPVFAPLTSPPGGPGACAKH
jgi:hypothetical protein